MGRDGPRVRHDAIPASPWYCTRPGGRRPRVPGRRATAPRPAKTNESSEACQEKTPRSHSAAWSSSTFSSFSSSGGKPAVQTTTKRVYDSDTGEVREVRRRSVGNQLVVEHCVHRDDGHTPETSSTRRF